jgi:hypothetical protein
MDDAVIDIVDRTIEVIRHRLPDIRSNGSPTRLRQDQFQSLYLKLPRGYGLTAAAVQLTYKYNSVIVTCNTQTLQYTSKNFDIDPKRLYTINDVINSCRGNSYFQQLDLLIYDPASAMLSGQMMKNIDALNLILDDKVTMFAYLG